MQRSSNAIIQNPENIAAKQDMVSAEKRAQAATNILRTMVNCKCQTCRASSRPEHGHGLSACFCVVQAGGIVVLTKLQQATLVGIKNNCVITIHTVLRSLFMANKTIPRQTISNGQLFDILSEIIN